MPDLVAERFQALFGPEFGHGKAFDFDALIEVLDRLDGPQGNLPPVFHIAGTNGKGSTIAFMRAIAEAAGLRVHAFTKPQLFYLNERFVVSSEVASDETLIAMAEAVAEARPEITQFDAQVATALALFDRNYANLVLLETGMGGRDDSTNVVPRPTACIITPIGLDHQDALGATLTDITAHKAGILKRHSPAVVARQAPEAMEMIEAVAADLQAPLYRQGVEWDAFVSHGRLVVQTERRTLDLPLPALRGDHQIDNAGLACAAFLAPGPFNFDDDAFAAGIANARWRARLEPLTRGPFSAPIRALGGEVWIDGGHNALAAAALARALGQMSAGRGRETIAIVGLRRRKDAKAFVHALAPGVARIIAAPLMEDHVAPAEIVAIAHAIGVAAAAAPTLSAAMQSAAQSPAPRVLICGSFLLAAEALALEGA